MRPLARAGACISLSAGILALAVLPAWSGAFQLNERSAKALGASLAGSVSAASDITFIGFNPAALGQVGSVEAGGNVSAVIASSEGRVTTGPALGATDNPGQARGIPAAAFGYRVTDRLVLGLSSYSPFGFTSTYDLTFPGIADGLTSELLTVTIAPMAAYEVVEGLSLGAALNVFFLDARLTSAAVNLDGDALDIGFSVGALWEVTDSTQIGIAYHHGYNDLEITGGQQNGFAVGPPLAGLSAPTSVRASLPGLLQVGVTQEITEDWTLMGEARWINWSVFDSIDVTTPAFAGTPLGAFSEVQNYEDSFFVALGVEFAATERLTLRGGVSWDETPTTDAFRTVRVPDEDRIWLSIGGSYEVAEGITVDLAYNYLRGLRDARLTLRSGPVAGSQVEYQGRVHIVSIGGAVAF